MNKIKLDYTNVMNFLTEKEIEAAIPEYLDARKKVLEKSGEGGEMLGWVDLPQRALNEEIDDIEKTAKEIRKNCDVFISIGIGGSYLGARAVVEALLPSDYNRKVKPEIYFTGNSLSTNFLNDLKKVIGGRDFIVNVISKSGTTTEPALAFRIIRSWMEEKYSTEEISRRIIATTDSKKGALRQLADEMGLKTFIIPDDVGGRSSVLTPVGLLPIAVAGVDVRALLEGAVEGMKEFKDEPELMKNPSSLYAVLRNIIYDKGKKIEIIANFDPRLHYISEWWKQLFGESEGKDGEGLYPASCDFTTDLHSMGQWIQQGVRNIFETFIDVKNCGSEIIVPEDKDNLDKLNFVSGKTLEYVNRQAFLGTSAAHLEGGVPNMTVELPELSAKSIGKLFYFFEWAVGISGYMLGVNPFNQPGVEDYKNNMFALLGKPGYEERTKLLKEKLAVERKIV